MFSRTAATGAARTAFTINDAAFGEVIGGHFDPYGIAYDRSDTKTTHPTGGIGDYAMTIFQHDAETAIGQDFINRAIKTDGFLFGQNQACARLIADSLPLRPVSSS